MTVPAELRFLAACSFLPATPEGFARQKQQLEAGLTAGLTPEAIWAGIDRHRIFALAEHVLQHHNMLHALGHLQPKLLARSRQSRLQSLCLASVSVQLSVRLSKTGIVHHFFKGPLLSQRIYADAGLRHSKDLDLIVPQSQLEAAVESLQAEGWQLFESEMWQQGGLFRKIAELRLRHLTLSHPGQRINLDLHWRFEAAPSPELETLWWTLFHDRSSQISQAESLLLCLHGASHAWSRLKWLGDLASIVERQPGIWAASQQICSALRLELVSAQTIALLRLLFDIAPDPVAADLLQRYPRASGLVAFSLSEMQSADPYGKRPALRQLALRQYSSTFATRFPRPARLLEQLAFWFVHDSSILRRHPLFIIGMPAARAWSIFNRYTLSEK